MKHLQADLHSLFKPHITLAPTPTLPKGQMYTPRMRLASKPYLVGYVIYQSAVNPVSIPIASKRLFIPVDPITHCTTRCEFETVTYYFKSMEDAFLCLFLVSPHFFSLFYPQETSKLRAKCPEYFL